LLPAARREEQRGTLAAVEEPADDLEEDAQPQRRIPDKSRVD
jgi:hypothetical protein